MTTNTNSIVLIEPPSELFDCLLSTLGELYTAIYSTVKSPSARILQLTPEIKNQTIFTKSIIVNFQPKISFLDIIRFENSCILDFSFKENLDYSKFSQKNLIFSGLGLGYFPFEILTNRILTKVPNAIKLSMAIDDNSIPVNFVSEQKISFFGKVRTCRFRNDKNFISNSLKTKLGVIKVNILDSITPSSEIDTVGFWIMAEEENGVFRIMNLQTPDLKTLNTFLIEKIYEKFISDPRAIAGLTSPLAYLTTECLNKIPRMKWLEHTDVKGMHAKGATDTTHSRT